MTLCEDRELSGSSRLKGDSDDPGLLVFLHLEVVGPEFRVWALCLPTFYPISEQSDHYGEIVSARTVKVVLLFLVPFHFEQLQGSRSELRSSPAQETAKQLCPLPASPSKRQSEAGGPTVRSAAASQQPGSKQSRNSFQQSYLEEQPEYLQKPTAALKQSRGEPMLVAEDRTLPCELCIPEQMPPNMFPLQHLKVVNLLTTDTPGHACLVQLVNPKLHGARWSSTPDAFANGGMNVILALTHDTLGLPRSWNCPLASVSIPQPMLLPCQGLQRFKLFGENDRDCTIRMGSKGFPYLDEALQSTQLSTNTYGNDALWRWHCFQCRSPDAYNTDNRRDMSGCLVCSSMPVGSAGNEKEWIACIGGGSCVGETGSMLHDLPIWLRSGITRAWGLQIYQALITIERCQNSACHSQSLMSNRNNLPFGHDLRINNLLPYAEQERLIRTGAQEQACHQNEYVFQVLNHAGSHMMVFEDDVYWILSCMDGQPYKVYNIDPYGDKDSISIYFRSPRLVSQTVQDIMTDQAMMADNASPQRKLPGYHPLIAEFSCVGHSWVRCRLHGRVTKSMQSVTR